MSQINKSGTKTAVFRDMGSTCSRYRDKVSSCCSAVLWTAPMIARRGERKGQKTRPKVLKFGHPERAHSNGIESIVRFGLRSVHVEEPMTGHSQSVFATAHGPELSHVRTKNRECTTDG